MEGSLGYTETTAYKDVPAWTAPKARIEFNSNDQIDSFVFKVWHKGTSYMSLLDEEGLAPTVGLKVGQRIGVKYYSTETSTQCQYLDTVIRKISRKTGGLLNDRYLVEMEILN